MKMFLFFCNTLLLMVLLAGFLTAPEATRVPVDPGGEVSVGQRLKYRSEQLRHRSAVWLQHHVGRVYRAREREIKDAAFAWLGLNIIVLLGIWVWPRRAKDRITLEVNGGRVSIAVRALEDSLYRILRQDVNVKDARVKVIPLRGRVQVRAILTLVENINLPVLEEALLERLRHHFEVIFPAEEPVEYEVEIQKLRASGSLPPAAPSPPVNASAGDAPSPTTHATPTERPMYP